MKPFYTLLIAVLCSFAISAQNIDIPDANFKSALIDEGVDTNDDGEISVSEAEAITSLDIIDLSISSLEGIEHFVNLTFLDCGNNQLTTLDVSNLSNLIYLGCYLNQLTTLTLGNANNLFQIECNNNQLTSLDLSGLPNLTQLYCNNNLLTSLDISNHLTPMEVIAAQNNQLTSLFLKNGLYDTEFFPDIGTVGSIGLSNNPNLSYICADEIEYEQIELMMEVAGITNYTLNSYCSFNPGGEYYSVEGTTFMDSDSNGCDTNDTIFPNLNFEITNGTETGSFISNSTGAYSIPVQSGTHNITPTFENPNYFSVSPSSLTVDFPSDASPFIQDFCITPNGAYDDLEIIIIPLDEARPGFDANYKIVYKNKGTTTLSGDIDLGFQDLLMDYVTATPANESGLTDLLSWSFSDLTPFESREILFTININSPMETPPVNGDDVLSFTTTISSVATEETPQDNTFQLLQTVVNAFDPNDKTCLEGAVIAPEQAGEFVHYRIRFENTGTASAINVVIKDHIDRTKYDLSSLVPLDASHDYIARITDDADDYYVEFIFENINLPFDDANNDGYVVFKIRTLDTLVLGDSFENQAEIYFDFNFPIITNVAQTTIATLSTEDYAFSNNITLYPNPTKDILYLESTHAISQISIYDISGRPIQKIAVVGSKMNIDISTESLSAGTYFMKILSEGSETVKKFIKD